MADLTLDEIRKRIRQNMAAVDQKPKPGSALSSSEITSASTYLETQDKLSILEKEVRDLNSRYDISTDQPITSHRKLLGPVLIFGKKVVREGLKWYVKPPHDQQREFNGSVVRSMNQLKDLAKMQKETTEAAILQLKTAEQKMTAVLNSQQEMMVNKENVEADLMRLTRRLAKLEKSMTPASFTPVLTVPRQDYGNAELKIDYFKFEQKFRGDRKSIKSSQQRYLQYYSGKKDVLDIGCGRGEFIELMIENGVGIKGIDLNDDMVGYCTELGLPVVRADAFEYLNSIEDESLDGIFAAQVIEHLPPHKITGLIELAYRKLAAQGILIMETINPENFIALSKWFFVDMTHVTPVHPVTLMFLLESEGFTGIERIDLNPNYADRIPHIANNTGNAEEINALIDQINGRLYGPQDYAIVARKPAEG